MTLTSVLVWQCMTPTGSFQLLLVFIILCRLALTTVCVDKAPVFISSKTFQQGEIKVSSFLALFARNSPVDVLSYKTCDCVFFFKLLSERETTKRLRIRYCKLCLENEFFILVCEPRMQTMLFPPISSHIHVDVFSRLKTHVNSVSG